MARPPIVAPSAIAWEDIEVLVVGDGPGGMEAARVAAIDLEVAEEALSLIKVDYEGLTPVFDPREAMKADAPLLHEGIGGYRQAVYNRLIPGTNICNHFKLRKGDVEKGFAEAELILKVTVWTTTQVPSIAG